MTDSKVRYVLLTITICLFCYFVAKSIFFQSNSYTDNNYRYIVKSNFYTGITAVKKYDRVGKNLIEEFELNKDSMLINKNIHYFENGNIFQELSYQQGKLHGLYSIFHKNGVLKKQGFKCQGEKVGEVFTYNENSELVDYRFLLNDSTVVYTRKYENVGQAEYTFTDEIGIIVENEISNGNYTVEISLPPTDSILFQDSLYLEYSLTDELSNITLQRAELPLILEGRLVNNSNKYLYCKLFETVNKQAILRHSIIEVFPLDTLNLSYSRTYNVSEVYSCLREYEREKGLIKEMK